MNPFEFVRVASLRAAQLMRGCTPRLQEGHRAILTAQHEVAAGKVPSIARPEPAGYAGAAFSRL